MKVQTATTTTTILAVLVLLASNTLAMLEPESDYALALVCGQKNPSINTAISSFCDRTNAKGDLTDDMFVPGPFSSVGVAVKGVRVKITGNCNPPEWVPFQFCGPQFHQICGEAWSEKDGFGTWLYGTEDCQTWSIGPDG